MFKKLFKRSKTTAQCAIQNVNNSCDKTIVWGGALFDTETLKDADVHITGIYINNADDIVTIIREVGLDVKRITMSMENARAIGFINLNALNNYC